MTRIAFAIRVCSLVFLSATLTPRSRTGSRSRCRFADELVRSHEVAAASATFVRKAPRECARKVTWSNVLGSAYGQGDAWTSRRGWRSRTWVGGPPTEAGEGSFG